MYTCMHIYLYIYIYIYAQDFFLMMFNQLKNDLLQGIVQMTSCLCLDLP